MFATRIRELRQDKHLTQAGLAEKAGVSQQAVGLWERRKNMPSHDLVAKLASLFNVTTDYLLGVSDSPGPGQSHYHEYQGMNTLAESNRHYKQSETKTVETFTPEEKAIILAYRAAPEHIRDIVKTALRTDPDNQKNKQPSE